MILGRAFGTLVESDTGKQLSPAEASAAIAVSAARLRATGVGRGDRVLLLDANRASFFIDVTAAWTLGACAVPLDPRISAFELCRIADALRPRAVVWRSCSSNDEPRLCALAQLGMPLLTEPSADSGATDAREADIRLDDAALVLLTSGTTGEPKAVVHTHRGLRARWIAQQERLGIAAFDRLLCAVPTAFAWGLVGNALFTWLSGGTVVLLPPFRPDLAQRIGSLCDEYAITALPASPAAWQMWTRMSPPPRAGTLKLALSGTGPINPTLAAAVLAWSGAERMANVYGITETGWIAAALGSSPDVADSVGTPFGSIVRIRPLDEATAAGSVDESVGDCPVGTPGEIWVTSASLMQGYHDRPDWTIASVHHGWFATGDVGYLDDRGNLHLSGRIKEMINVGGVKVYPSDLERLLTQHPHVIDAAAFGVAEGPLGDAVAVAVVLAEGARMDEVAQWLQQRLARDRWPRRWLNVEAVPRTPRGKIDRAALQRMVSL